MHVRDSVASLVGLLPPNVVTLNRGSCVAGFLHNLLACSRIGVCEGGPVLAEDRHVRGS